MSTSSRAVRTLLLAVSSVALVAATACSTGHLVLNPSNGNFSNADLSGSYVYQIRATNLQLGTYRESGVLTADGAGHVTGVDDFIVAGSALVTNNVTGTYSIAKDGTGFLNLGPTPQGTITLAITLAGKSKFQIIEADPGANGGGTAELQSSTALPSGTFVYRLHQIAATASQNPVSEVGTITITAGAVTGTFDQNAGGVSSQLTLTGSLGTPDSFGTGSGSFTDSSNFKTNFVFYVVNSTKILLTVSNQGLVESGSAEMQSGAVGNGLSGNYVFGSRGDSGNFFDFIDTVGQFSASNGVISSFQDDSMSFGNYSTQSLTGSYTAAANGRVAVSLGSGAIQQVFWMVSPSRAFFLTNDPAKVEDGTADLQTSASFAASTFKGQFVLVMDGNDSQSFLGPELLSRVGTLQFDGTSGLVLNEVANASNSGTGATSPGTLSGNYQASSSGRIVAALNGSTLNFVMYAISGSDAYILQTDASTNTEGTLQLQQ